MGFKRRTPCLDPWTCPYVHVHRDRERSSPSSESVEFDPQHRCQCRHRLCLVLLLSFAHRTAFKVVHRTCTYALAPIQRLEGRKCIKFCQDPHLSERPKRKTPQDCSIPSTPGALHHRVALTTLQTKDASYGVYQKLCTPDLIAFKRPKSAFESRGEDRDDARLSALPWSRRRLRASCG
eukprot:scaffold1384_cov256-Pinguiococcus_pyrenoidosus.AAC.11